MRSAKGVKGTARTLGLAAVLACVQAHPAFADPIPANWLTPSNGNWADANAWSTHPAYPENGTPAGAVYNARIGASGAGYSVTLDPLSDLTVNELVVDSLNATVLQKSHVLEATGIFDLNRGSWQISGGGVRAGSIRVGGDVLFNGNSFFEPGTGGLTIASGGLVRTGLASVWVGHNARPLVNQGTISAQGGGRMILLGSLIDNQRVIEARGGQISVAGVLPGGSPTTLTGGTWAVYDNSALYLPAITTNAATLVLSGPTSYFSAMDTLRSNTGTLNIVNGRSFDVSTGAGLVNTGTITIGTGSVLVNDIGFTQSGGGIGGGGKFQNNGGLAVIGGGQNWADGAEIEVIGGRVVLDSSAGSAASMGLAVRVARSGLAVFNAPQYLKQMDVDGKVALGYGGGHTLHTKLLTMSTGGQVDVGDSSLVVQAVSGTRDAVLGQVTSWVISALQSEAGHPWEGPGITSSLAASNSLAGVAVSINDLGGGQRIRPDLDVYAVIAKATWDGDLNLDGVVNLNDYFRMDSGYLAGAKGYTNGDINYDGAINLNDYFLMDAAYLGQSQVLAGSSAMVIIPEPGVVGIWGLAMAFGLRRRGGRRVR